MDTIALVVAIAALLVALAAYARAGGLASRLEDGVSDARRVARGASEEVGASLETLRELLARVAEGRPVDRGMILEGRLWRDASDAEAQRILQEEQDLFVLDVRTPDEARGGVLPGAKLIPVDELEARRAEVPRSARTILVYCAAGARSAAACEFLAGQGYQGLVNLESGYGGWSGPREPLA